MAFISLNKYRKNNVSKAVQCLALDVDASSNRVGKYRIISGTNLPVGGYHFLRVGDTALIGQVPRNCVVTDIRVIWHEGFPDATEFDFGFLADFPDDTITVTQADIVADNTVENGTMYLNVNNTGAIDPSGSSIASADGDFRGALWNGDKRPLMLGINIKNASLANGDDLTKGKCTFLVSYIRFDKDDIFDEEDISTDGYFQKYFVS